MTKDSDSAYQIDPSVRRKHVVVLLMERYRIVRFLRKFTGMEEVAERIERGEYLDAKWAE